MILGTKTYPILKEMNSGSKPKPFLEGVLGWGTEDRMDSLVHRGKKGMDGVLEFARYFIEECGVSEGLFEGKFSGLLDALERM